MICLSEVTFSENGTDYLLFLLNESLPTILDTNRLCHNRAVMTALNPLVEAFIF